ncbi:MAG: VOC family protein [Gordonia sp. (in: high G+C Gram-positive bacteria)]|uniref:VOC family protein n=1 Tax=Gordonia sp. (in: high G+C Gram-positive bacteria) TaxID=84139 RepID=UPI003C78BD0E
MTTNVTQIHDPLSISDLHISLPVADRTEAATMYDLLLGQAAGQHWLATNGSISLLDAAAPLTIDLGVADLAASQTLLQKRGMTLGANGTLVDVPPLRIAELAGVAVGTRMIDHIVLTVGNADSAIALFGGRLGINLRLVKDLGKGVAQLFFRTRSAVIEVVAGTTEPSDGIGVMGLAWRSDDIEAEQQRLVAAGLAVSDVRTGRKPGTKVCTVREPGLGTATLLIEQ